MVLSGVILRVITILWGTYNPLRTTHEPPSGALGIQGLRVF